MLLFLISSNQSLKNLLSGAIMDSCVHIVALAKPIQIPKAKGRERRGRRGSGDGD